MFGNPRHLRVREDPAIKLPPLPLRLPGQAEVAPANLRPGVVAPDQIGEADNGELQGLSEPNHLAIKPAAEGPWASVGPPPGVLPKIPLPRPLLLKSRSSQAPR